MTSGFDPGHGGPDPGNLGINNADAPNEEDLTLAVAQYLEPQLFTLGYFCVHKTRNTDQEVLKRNRAKIANGELQNYEPFTDTCRLFVSIHMNSGPSSAFGTETWVARTKYFAKNAKVPQADIDAATEIQADLMTKADVVFGVTCSDDRGVRYKNFTVLTRSKSPAVLVEVCFLTRTCQWNKIIQSNWQSYLSDGIASGVSGFLGYSSCQPFGAVRGDDLSGDVQSNTGLAASSVLRVETPLTSAVQGIATTLVEDFEEATFPPTAWTTQTAGLAVPHRWHRTTDPDFVGQGIASAYVGSGSPSAIDEWLISPAVLIAPPDDAIKFSWSGSKYWSNSVNASLSQDHLPHSR